MEVLDAASDHTVQDSMALQYDNKSMNAEKMAPVINALRPPREARDIHKLLRDWDFRLDRDSAAAAVFDIWEQSMLNLIYLKTIPIDQHTNVAMPSRQKLTEWVLDPPEFIFGENPEKERDLLMNTSLRMALNYLNDKLGTDSKEWSYGKLHFAEIVHPLSHLVDQEMKDKVDIASLPRGGGSNTLNANHGNSRQTSGASFRMIVDTSDWDAAVGTNSPGQSADPRSPHYEDLFENWNKGKYFPMYYSKDKIMDNAGSLIHLKPIK
tara:strand:- start:333 stop:1130 length:798 start_codon:yes stop_codon:yes gene_type:complete